MTAPEDLLAAAEVVHLQPDDRIVLRVDQPVHGIGPELAQQAKAAFGGRELVILDSSITLEHGVMAQVLAERARQDAKWGEQNHPDGTSPLTGWTVDGDLPACRVAELAREATDRAAERGDVTWRDILLEEMAEAFAEEDPDALRTELIQVAAVAVQWAEAIDRRAAARVRDLAEGGRR